jgi:hypothetical protein
MTHVEWIHVSGNDGRFYTLANSEPGAAVVHLADKRDVPFVEWIFPPGWSFESHRIGESKTIHPDNDPAYWVTITYDENSPPPHHFLGFGWGLEDAVARGGWEVVVPYWFLVIAFATPPICWLVRAIRRSRRPALGFCANCGYDLRATPHRCPECGAACKAANPAGESPVAGN